MFDEFNKLHDSRESDSLQYFSFYDLEGNLLTGSIAVTFDENGQFSTLTQIKDDVATTYNKGEYTYTTECLYVLGIGFLLPGDVVKLHIDSCKEYELNWGWHINVSGQNIYSWYLKPIHKVDVFADDRNGLFKHQDPDITNTGILTFYKEYLQTIEVVEFRKDRISFNII